MKKILVTGGFGFIGYHLITHLLENKKGQVIVMDDTPREKYTPEIRSLIKRYQKNLMIIQDEISTLKKWPEIEEVYHLAGNVASKGVTTDPFLLLQKNILLMEKILYAYGKTKTKILFTSSTEVLGNISTDHPFDEDTPIGWFNPQDPRWTYSIAKFICEQLLIHYSLDTHYKIARLSNVYGPHMKKNYVIKSLIKRILSNEKPLLLAHANDTRSFTFVSDIVRGLVIFMESKIEREIIILGTPKETSISELARKLLRLNGENTSNLKIDQASNTASERRLPNTLKAKKLLGWEATTTLDEGLMKTLAYYKNLN